MVTTLLEHIGDETDPPPRETDYGGGVVMRWSPDRLFLQTPEGQHPWSADALIAVQLSRSEELLPRGFMRRLFRRPAHTQHHLHLEMRVRPSTRARFRARVEEPDALEGLPVMVGGGEELPYEAARDVVHAACVLGANLALVKVERLDQGEILAAVEAPWLRTRSRQPPPPDLAAWLEAFRGSERALLVAFVETWLPRVRDRPRLEKYGMADALADRITTRSLIPIRNKVLINLQHARALPRAWYRELGLKPPENRT